MTRKKPSSTSAAPSNAPRIIKKYPNRRLYDTASSSYIALADVKQLVVDAVPFVVQDAKGGQDITRSLLLQIILEDEAGSVPMFTTTVLSNIIRFQGQAMRGLMGYYLEKNMHSLTELQGQLQTQVQRQAKHLTPDMWQQLLQPQPTAFQDLLDNYMAQSQSVFSHLLEPFKPKPKGEDE